MHPNIPTEVIKVVETLENGGFEAFLVGGCVRDLMIDREPKDWDITTNAKPEEIMRVFPDSFYENTFGTVGVKIDTENNTLKVIEVTPYRIEGEYSDNRHPDTVVFSQKLEDDLQRRDFTMNSLAYSVSNNEVIDLYGGKKDIKDKIIRTVGDADKRFNEDGLRILRAVRLSAELEFEIEEKTEKSILLNSSLLKNISKERIRDEFTKIIMSKNPMKGILMMKKLGILEYVVPELEETIGVEQGGVHTYDVWEHLLRSLQHSADKDYPLEIRLSALFHDISKPETRRGGGKNKKWTFFGHEVLGARKTKKILENLKYPTKIIEKTVSMIRWHMFFSDTEQISLSAVRRMIVNVGRENIWDLMNLRICDRIGAGRPKEDPYRLRKYHSMIEEALRDPISVGMLNIDGKKIMEITKNTPGPKIGFTLHALLEEVLEDPTKNTTEYLENKAIELMELPESELKKLGEKGKISKEEADNEEIKKIRSEHRVK
ncbi:MAG TPA: CCA tRNA nucleotidyltransferase [Parcubacteria group bacterium]|jgi:putative nucleotidyltransferase with HDIG domain|nr:CCA tRNA nucleotidyltransferase [Parcubacteria group bacterium]